MMEYRVGMKLVQNPIQDDPYPNWAGRVLTVTRIDMEGWIHFEPVIDNVGFYSKYVMSEYFILSKPRILENE